MCLCLVAISLDATEKDLPWKPNDIGVHAKDVALA